MSPRWWPALLLLCAACSNGFWACGRGYAPCCSTTPAVIRDVTYLGFISASDGGASTQVKLVVGTNGNGRLTFVRDGVEVAETFTAAVRD